MRILNVFIAITISIYFVWVIWFIATTSIRSTEEDDLNATTTESEARTTAPISRKNSRDAEPSQKWSDLLKNYKMAKRILLKVFRDRLKTRQLLMENKLKGIRWRKSTREEPNLWIPYGGNGSIEDSRKPTIVWIDYDSVKSKNLTTTLEYVTVRTTSNRYFQQDVTPRPQKSSPTVAPEVDVTIYNVRDNQKAEPWSNGTTKEDNSSVYGDYSNSEESTIISTNQTMHEFSSPQPALILIIDYRWFDSNEVSSASISPAEGSLNQTESDRPPEVGESNNVFLRTSNRTVSSGTIRLLDDYLTLFVWVLIGWAFLGVTMLLIAVLAFARVKETLNLSDIKKRIVSSETFRGIAKVSSIFEKRPSNAPFGWSFESPDVPYTHIHLESPGSSCSSLVSLRSIMDELVLDSDQ